MLWMRCCVLQHITSLAWAGRRLVLPLHQDPPRLRQCPSAPDPSLQESTGAATAFPFNPKKTHTCRSLIRPKSAPRPYNRHISLDRRRLLKKRSSLAARQSDSKTEVLRFAGCHGPASQTRGRPATTHSTQGQLWSRFTTCRHARLPQGQHASLGAWGRPRRTRHATERRTPA